VLVSGNEAASAACGELHDAHAWLASACRNAARGDQELLTFAVGAVNRADELQDAQALEWASLAACAYEHFATLNDAEGAFVSASLLRCRMVSRFGIDTGHDVVASAALFQRLRHLVAGLTPALVARRSHSARDQLAHGTPSGDELRALRRIKNALAPFATLRSDGFVLPEDVRSWLEIRDDLP
jgi:hypothetical protein